MKQNFLTRSGAEYLAGRIETYWRSRGYSGIETRLEGQAVRKAGGKKGELEMIWFVRSNIVNGYPPKTHQRLAA